MATELEFYLLRESYDELRDRALFEIAYSSGLRAEELVNLDLASVDFDAEELRVEGKGAKTRFVPAGEPALRSIAAYLERARPALAGVDPEPALFLSKSGRRLSTRMPPGPRSMVWAAIMSVSERSTNIAIGRRTHRET